MQRINPFKTKFFWKLLSSYCLAFLVVGSVSVYFLMNHYQNTYPELAADHYTIFKHFVFYAGALVFGIFFVVCAIVSRRVIYPLQEMMQVCEAMRGGDYTQKVRFIPKDEVGRMADTLNKLGDEVTQNISQMEKLESIRRNFVANVSHEIKTPLTSIQGYAETLLDGALEDPLNNRRFLNKIQSNCGRLMALVQDILSLAKIESTDEKYDLTPTGWSPLIKSVIDNHDTILAKKHLSVQVEHSSGDFSVLGNIEFMYQILDNLLSNAIRYAPMGEHIKISTYCSDSVGHIQVEDYGVGIPEKHLSRIFERFYRVDKARSREMGGTGLGLAIVKHLVSALGGTIDVTSELGIGSKFTVSLPLAKSKKRNSTGSLSH